MRTSTSWLVEANVPATGFSTRFHIVAATAEKALGIARHGFPDNGWHPAAYENSKAPRNGSDLICEFHIVGPGAPVYIEH